MSKLIRINEITPEDLRAMQEIDRQCNKMHLPCPPKTRVNMKVRMPNGDLVFDYDFLSKSWIRNAHNHMLCQFLQSAASDSTYGAGYHAMKRTTGDVDVIATVALQLVGGAAQSYIGIVVGTGSGAESFEGYDLTTPVANGTGAGQLSYVAQEDTTWAYVSGTKTWTATLKRYMNNNSGGTIVVTEVGIYGYYSGAYYSYLLCRDLLGASVSVLDTAQLTVTYTIDYVFPA